MKITYQFLAGIIITSDLWIWGLLIYYRFAEWTWPAIFPAVILFVAFWVFIGIAHEEYD